MSTPCNVVHRKHPEGAARVGRSRGCLVCVLGVAVSLSSAMLAQAPGSQQSDASKSWSAATDSVTDSANPTRTFQSHTQSSDRTIDTRSIQTRGPDGNFIPYQDIETETVKVNATTSRTITRTFVRGGDGAKALFQVTEEERRTLPGGDSNVMRTTSNPDANGNLQLVQREIRETRKSGPDVQETKTTVQLPSINGGLAPVMETQESQKRSGRTVEIQKTTLLPDGDGKWQVGEVRRSTISDDGKARSKEERVFRPDSEGKMGEVSRTVSKETSDVSGEAKKSEATYSVDVPGAASDGSLHLVERVSTTQRSSSSGQRTTQTTEQANPGDPGSGLVVSTITTDTVRPGTSGGQATRTVEIRGGSGDLGVVSVDTTKSTSVQAIQVQIAPPKPK